MNPQLLLSEDSEGLLEGIIYVAGTSFILGSLITILLLVLLDHLRLKRENKLPNSTRPSEE